MNGIAEAGSIHQNVVLREERVGSLQNLDAKIAYQLELLNLLFKRNQSEDIRRVRSDAARLIRIGHDEAEAKRQTGLLAGWFDDSNLRRERKITGVMRGVHARQLEIRNERSSLRFHIEKILDRAFDFNLGNLADAHSHAKYTDGSLIAAQSGERKTHILQKVKADLRAQVARGNGFRIGGAQWAVLRKCRCATQGRNGKGQEQFAHDTYRKQTAAPSQAHNSHSKALRRQQFPSGE